jgi:hypothetical protein
MEPDMEKWLGVIAAARERATLFNSKEAAGSKLIEWLAGKRVPLDDSALPLLAAALLLRAHQHQPQWPVELVQAYLEDSFGARCWVDARHAAVRHLVANILTVFHRPTEPCYIDGQPLPHRYPASVILLITVTVVVVVVVVADFVVFITRLPPIIVETTNHKVLCRYCTISSVDRSQSWFCNIDCWSAVVFAGNESGK